MEEKRDYLKEIADNSEKIYQQVKTIAWMLFIGLLIIIYLTNK